MGRRIFSREFKPEAMKLVPGGLTEYPKVQALHDWIAADPAVQTVPARDAGT